MDNITHSLLGVVMARSGLSRKHGRGTTALLVVASNIPDLDAVQMLLHPEASAWLRRTHTHCVLGGPLLAVALAVAWTLGSRGRMRLPVTLGLSLLGVAGHVLLDLFNSYGVVVLWPFSAERYELAWVYIIDLAMWGLLLAPILLRRLLRERVAEVTLHRAALALYVAYVGLCAAGHARAESLLARHLAAEGAPASFTYAFPEALGPHRWRAVARDGDRWRMWLVHVLEPDGAMELVREVRTAAEEPGVAAVRQTPRGRDVERFFKAPVWEVDATRTRATCTDLRFYSAIIARRTGPFVYEFELAAPGGR